MGRKILNINLADGPVGFSNYTRQQFINTIEKALYAADKETLVAGGAVSLLVGTTHLDSTAGAYALTLADGSSEQEMKRIYHIGTGGVWTMTPTNLWDWTSVVFSAYARTAELIWVNGKWRVVAGDCGVV